LYYPEQIETRQTAGSQLEALKPKNNHRIILWLLRKPILLTSSI